MAREREAEDGGKQAKIRRGNKEREGLQKEEEDNEEKRKTVRERRRNVK